MATRHLTMTMRQLRRLGGAPFAGALSDAELTARFVERRDEAAFEALVWRHGTLVLNVCRRVLRHDQDAEDAFQATFVILFRKAGTLGKQESVAAWLHRVAIRVALRARAAAERRRETTGVVEPAARSVPHGGEWAELVDREINRLPPRWRRVAVLCWLEGRTYAEAAAAIGCPLGTVQSRLGRARRRLQIQLAKQGVTVPAALAAALATTNSADAASTSLVHAALDAAAALAGVSGGCVSVSVSVASLTQQTLRGLWWSRLGAWAGKGALAMTLLSVAGWLTAAGFNAPKPLPSATRVGELPQLDRDPASAHRAALQRDLGRIEGEWQLVSGIEDGAPLSADHVQAMVLKFLPGNRVNLGCRRPDDSFALIAHTQPSKIQLIMNHADGTTSTSHGVYELTAESLRVCLGDERRPAEEFSSTSGSGRRLWTFRRPGAAPDVAPNPP